MGVYYFSLSFGGGGGAGAGLGMRACGTRAPWMFSEESSFIAPHTLPRRAGDGKQNLRLMTANLRLD